MLVSMQLEMLVQLLLQGPFLRLLLLLLACAYIAAAFRPRTAVCQLRRTGSRELTLDCRGSAVHGTVTDVFRLGVAESFALG